MRTNRGAVVAATVVTAVAGLAVATAGPAAAATGDLPGTWRVFGSTNPITNSKSTWVCAKTHTITTDLLAQVCVIRGVSSDGTTFGELVQSAVIVRNNRSSSYSVSVATDLSNYRTSAFIARWTCSASAPANGWSVCFSANTDVSPNDKAVARGGVNGVDLGVTAQL